jgi:hypothetical protein
MNRWLAVAFMALLLIASGYLFGMVCERIGGAYALILSPSRGLGVLLLQFLLALAAVLTSAGLVAVLLRPLWLGMAAFALSALALLGAWQITPPIGLLALLYGVTGAAYVMAVERELGQRLKFSAHPVIDSQSALRVVCIVVACGSLYLGSAPRIRREGLTIPDTYLEPLAAQMERQILASVPPEQRTQAVQEFRVQFQQMMDGLVESVLGRHQGLLPLLFVAGVFMSLMTAVNLLAWVPGLGLDLLFPMLGVLGVTQTITETREVERLVLA